MDKAAFHPSTREHLDNFLKSPSHALCLVGPQGAGKGYAASLVAGELLGKTAGDALYHLGEDEAGIGIEQIRALQQFLRLKKPGHAATRRMVIIENAQNMSGEAQNALLKTLEEPPADAVFILTTDGSATLRSTIYSRVQSVHIMPLSLDQATEYFGNKPGLAKFYHLSGGYAGLLYALLNDPEHHLVEAVEQAKGIIRSTSYERLLLVDGLAKQKESLPTLLYALQRVAGALLAGTTDAAKLKRLTATRRAIYQAELDSSKSANTKLLLTDLFLNL